MSLTPFVVLALLGLALGDELPLPRPEGRMANRHVEFFVRGESTSIQQYPYQLSLRLNDIIICGASIIGQYYALTAAHCIYGASPSAVSLHAGITYQNETGSKHQAKAITVNPKYRGNDYDSAIIEVDTPFPLDEPGIRTIELCSVEPSSGQKAVVTGWSKSSAGSSSANQLQAVTVPVISRAVCQGNYPGYDITQSMICTGTHTGGNNACDGDPGSPMVVEGKQCGIVSWGMGCRYPSVYSNVADQLSWIQSKTRK